MGGACSGHTTNLEPSPPSSLARKKPLKRVEQIIIGVDEQDGCKTINEYKILRELGEGSYGKVCLALNVENSMKIAMKTVFRKLLRKGNLSSEVDILKRLSHPNIIKLFEVIDDPSHSDLILIFEYVEGGAVRNLDQNWCAVEGPLELGLTRVYMKQIISGLEYLHQNHIIHRDIKPDNILLSVDRRTVKLGDFGVSHLFSGDDDSIRITGGTPCFHAPEMCRDEYVSGAYCDIWALGVTMYIFMYGKVPWTPRCGRMALMKEIQTKEIMYESDQQYDIELMTLLRRMLERDVLRRITVSEIKHNPWLSGTVVPVCDKEAMMNAVRNSRFSSSDSRDSDGKRRRLEQEECSLPRLPEGDEVAAVSINSAIEAAGNLGSSHFPSFSTVPAESFEQRCAQILVPPSTPTPTDPAWFTESVYPGNSFNSMNPFLPSLLNFEFFHPHARRNHESSAVGMQPMLFGVSDCSSREYESSRGQQKMFFAETPVAARVFSTNMPSSVTPLSNEEVIADSGGGAVGPGGSASSSSSSGGSSVAAGNRLLAGNIFETSSTFTESGMLSDGLCWI